MKKEKNYLIIQYQLNVNESENLNISSSNIVADKVDIKAKNVVIESKQDKTESKNSSYGASVSVAVSPAGVELKNISVNGAKGKGKGSWTSAQTSVIAKNGGEITTDNFKDIGAIVGSENEKEKLKIQILQQRTQEHSQQMYLNF